MYSDDSSDEDATTFPECHPHLLLFGEDEAEIKLRENMLPINIKGSEEDARALQRRKVYRSYRALRFFRSVEGFHKGSLDLTGRHQPRYVKLHTRWSNYLAEFFALAVLAEEYTTDELDWRGMPFTDYRFKDPKVWEDFAKKWRVPPVHWTYGSLLSSTESVLRTIAQHPLPQFQKLCLVDLPSEVIDTIYAHASMEQARLLSSTCRWLNDIGRRYIFRSRTLNFDFPLDCWREMNKAADPVVFLERLARLKREQALSAARFLLSRPDLMKKTRSLAILDQWSPALLESYIDGGFDVWAIERGFYVDMYTAYSRILAASPNLTTLRFFNIAITLDFIHCLAELPHLHTLDLFRCRIPPGVQEVLRTRGGISLSCSAYNLHLSLSAETFSLWHAVLLCPHLRSFSAQTATGDMLPPPPILWEKCMFFPNLERLCLSCINIETLDIYTTWLSSVPPMDKLTHFKFHSRSGFSDMAATSILSSLRASSLRVLALDGLAEGEFGLFQEIRYRYPELLGLTLFRRASDRQKRTRQVIWPHPAWEYAQHLEGLIQLQHFGWNYQDFYNYISCAPILRFEEGFYDAKKDMEKFITANKDDFFDEDCYTPVVFAAHCPSLKTYTAMDLLIDWRISRTADGKISVHTAVEGGFRVSSGCWSPTVSASHWPNVLPVEGSNWDRGDAE
ncbi:hypothetical protein Hypma_016098 [Hypsizygus marmoreus]|uniref:F-box domain-containing protein n=1 Tax=Hypsizygus marmoreus TaxID=39966 RepID=A0A369KA90_HYPMA|nr:hypothetical protein Hypma_016098 [Hypsizygus marmoreus]